MTKYILNDDDTVRIGNKLFSYDNDSPYIEEVKDNLDYGIANLYLAFALYKHGKEVNEIEIKDGDILQPYNDFYVPVVLVDKQLVDLSGGEEVNLTPHKTSRELAEFDKRDKAMSKDINSLKELIELAENDAVSHIDGTSYGTAHTYREIAELALSLANQQEWFDRYFK